MNGIVGLPAAELAGRVRRRQLGAEEIARAHLERTSALEPRLHAFLHLMPERALRQAREIDRRLASGDDPGPLAGVPLAIKDVFALAGEPTTCGSRLLEGYRPPYTATAVARLEAAGAVSLGKTNMDEFAMGSSTENSAYGPTRNPWDESRVPGGSSGGSAAAVAAAMVPLALGTDTGGSIRQPAALTGVVGLKPSWGRVSRYGLVAFASSLDQAGPLARRVEDAALALQVMAGPDPADATSADRPLPDLVAAARAGAEGLSVGVPRGALEEGVEPETLAAFEEALAQLATLGVRVLDVELPSAGLGIAAYYLVATAEASSNLARYDGVRYGARREGPRLADMYGATRESGFGAEVKRRILLGTFALSSGYYDAYYVQAQRVRSLLRADFARAFERCDAIATPTSPTRAFPLGERSEDPLRMYLADVFTVPANLAGLPGLSLPCGAPGGLPVGLQLVGDAFREDTLLRIAGAFERATPHHRAAPPLATPPPGSTSA